jgi:plasmid maintenance system antidote protein VapI
VLRWRSPDVSGYAGAHIITAILNGHRAITGDTALRLAHFFGTSAEFWLNLQSLYELRIAQKKVGNSMKALPRLKRPERIPA